MEGFWDEIEPGWNSGVSYEQPRTDVTVTQDLGTATAATNSGTSSGWGDALAKGFGKVLDFGLQRQAAKDNLSLQQQRAQLGATQPLVSTAGGTFGVSSTGLLLVAVVVGAVLLAKD
jgi:hypothetical protein